MNNILMYIRRKFWHLLGIEIGKSFVSMVELSYDGAKYYIETCQHLIFAQPLVSDVLIADAIDAALKQAKPQTKSVAIALAYPEVLLKEVQVSDGLSWGETKEYLRFSLASSGMADGGDFVFDYQRTSDPEKNNGSLNLQLVAAKKDLVNKWGELFWQVGLNVCAVDVDALERASRYQLRDISEIVAVININCERAMVVVLDKENILYAQVDSVAKVDLSMIEEIIRYLRTQLELIQARLVVRVGKLVIGGDRFTQFDLVNALGDIFAMPIVIANPFANMRLAQLVDPALVQQVSCSMLISCGLALRVGDG